MCYQISEVYSACKCLYYRRSVDRCTSYGRKGHQVENRTVYVGYACSFHSNSYDAPNLGESFSAVSERQAKITPSERDLTQKQKPEVGRESALDELSGARPSSLNLGNSSFQLELSESEASPLASSDNEALETEETEEDGEAKQTSVMDATVAKDLNESSTEAANAVAVYQSVGIEECFDVAPEKVEETSKKAEGKADEELDLDTLGHKKEKQGKIGQAFDDEYNGGESKGREMEGPLEGTENAEQLSRDFLNHKNLWVLQLPQILNGDEESIRLAWLMMRYALEESDSGHKAIYEGRGEGREAIQTYLATTMRENVDYSYRFIPASPSKNSIRDWVAKTKAAQVTSLKWRTRALQSLCYFYNMSISLAVEALDLRPGPGLSQGTTLKHQCHCGRLISDKYVELKSGALKRLKSDLERHGGPSSASHSSGGTVSQQTKGAVATDASYFSTLWDMISQNRNRATGILPSHHSGSKPEEQFGCPPQSQSVGGGHNYLLICLPFMRWATKLRQDEICHMNSDKEFFSLLQTCYKEARKTKAKWPWMRRVSAIDFVRFEVFENDLVDIRDRPSLPTGQFLDQYEFEDLQAEIMPPIGPNLMMHYFEHPHHANSVPTLLRRVPKKLRDKLHLCPIKKSSVGWGIHLVEGSDTFLIFCFGLAAFSLALAVAIAWAVTKNDVQGGFAISAFVLGLLLFIGNSGRVAAS